LSLGPAKGPQPIRRNGQSSAPHDAGAVGKLECFLIHQAFFVHHKMFRACRRSIYRTGCASLKPIAAQTWRKNCCPAIFDRRVNDIFARATWRAARFLPFISPETPAAAC
jgi:hypothetical protein